jgi:signal peptidase I
MVANMDKNNDFNLKDPSNTTKNGFSHRSLRWLANGVRELITALLPAILIALFVHVYVVEAVSIEDGPSMQPNLYVGYRVMTEKISYRFHPPRRGDIVVVVLPGDDPALIKRVMATEGETVEVRDGHTFIDGQAVEEPWVTNFGGMSYTAQRVPEDCVFILGDNRAVSYDSRAIGPVKVDEILGRAWLVYWPLEQVRLLP